MNGFKPNYSSAESVSLSTVPQPVWPDLVIFWTLGNFLKSLATINLPNSPTFLGKFCKGVKNFLVKSFLGNFYRHLAILFWSHWPQPLPNYSYSYLGITNIQVGLNLIYLISVFAGCYMNNEIERVKWTTFQLKYDPVNVSSSTPLNFLQQSSRLSHVMWLLCIEIDL